MTMLSSLARGFVVAALTAAPAVAQAQAARPVTVDFENAPLARVVESFATFSGRTITLAAGLEGRAVTSSVRAMDWELALGQILAAQSLIARPGTGDALRIERQRNISVDYQDAPLSGVVRDVAAFAGHRIVLAPAAGDPPLTVSIRDTDWQQALDQMLASVGLVARANREGALQIERR
jgi:ferric-dicitrate binding protein FerR (iron transport regulator)